MERHNSKNPSEIHSVPTTCSQKLSDDFPFRFIRFQNRAGPIIDDRGLQSNEMGGEVICKTIANGGGDSTIMFHFHSIINSIDVRAKFLFQKL